MLLEEINHLPLESAKKLLMQCCSSATWIKRVLDARPFKDKGELSNAANLAWNGLTEADLLEAFSGHPKIGDINSLSAKHGDSKALASNEQRLVEQASETVLIALSKANEVYLKKYGFIFIVCATGKNSTEMLALLNARLLNDRETELINAAEEQRKIFQIRLANCVEKE